MADGVDGTSGTNGTNGTNGVNGINGANGANGAQQQISLSLEDPGDPFGANSGLNSGLDPNRQIFPIIREFLQSEGGGSSRRNADRVAERIADMIPADESNWVLHDLSAELGMFMYKLAEQIPHRHRAHERLVRLFLILGSYNKLNLPDSHGQGGDIAELWRTSSVCLFSWPGFLEEDRNLYSIGEDEPDKDINGHAFLARLVGSGQYRYMWPTTTIWSLRDYLEQQAGSAPPGGGSYYPANPSVQFEATRISCMCMWMIYGGQELFTFVMSTDFREDSNHARAFGPGQLFDGGDDWQIGRWRFWRRQLASVQASDAGPEAADLATRTADLMLAIERSRGFR